jgi:hypothetical protein
MDEKKRRFSVGGIIVAAIMGLAFLGNLIIFLKADLPVEDAYTLRIISFMMLLVPTIAMLVRSFRPPVGFWRGLQTLFGGILVGISLIHLTMLVTVRFDAVTIVTFLIFLVSGVILLKLGFKAPT